MLTGLTLTPMMIPLCSVCKATLDSVQVGSSQAHLSQDPLLNINPLSSTTARKHASELIQEDIINIQNTIQQLERKIVELQARMHDLHLRQNELCGVSILPDDVLTEIWAYLAEDSGETIESTVQLLSISHVCSHWRNLALNTPALWRWPCLSHPLLASYLIERAGNNSLSLHVDFNRVSGWHAFSLARGFLHRAQSITLKTEDTMRSHSPDFISVLEDSNSGYLSELQTVTIQFLTYNYSNARHELDLFAFFQKAPALRKISLVNATFFDSPLSPTKSLSNLTYLSITFHREVLMGPSDPHVPLHRVLGALKLLPNLNHLSLIAVFRPLNEIDREWCRVHTQPVRLDFLRTLLLVTGIELTHIFLSNITHPEQTQVTLFFSSHSIGWDSEISDTDACHAMLATLLKSLDNPIIGLSLCLAYNRTFYCALFDTPSRQSSVRILWNRNAPKLLIHISKAYYSLQQLKFLSYNLEDSNTDIWKGFGLLPNLKKIADVPYIDNHPTLYMVLASFRPAGPGDSIFEPGDSASEPQLYFPSLDTIDGKNSPSTKESLARIMLVRKTWASRSSGNTGMDGRSLTSSAFVPATDELHS